MITMDGYCKPICNNLLGLSSQRALLQHIDAQKINLEDALRCAFNGDMIQMDPNGQQLQTVLDFVQTHLGTVLAFS